MQFFYGITGLFRDTSREIERATHPFYEWFLANERMKRKETAVIGKLHNDEVMARAIGHNECMVASLHHSTTTVIGAAAVVVTAHGLIRLFLDDIDLAIHGLLVTQFAGRKTVLVRCGAMMERIGARDGG